MESGKHVAPQPALEADAVRVGGDVDDPEPGAESGGCDGKHAPAGHERGGREGARREQDPEGCRRAAPEATREPAGERKHQSRCPRQREDDEPELATVEREPVLERREPCSPRAVEDAESLPCRLPVPAHDDHRP